MFQIIQGESQFSQSRSNEDWSTIQHYFIKKIHLVIAFYIAGIVNLCAKGTKPKIT